MCNYNVHHYTVLTSNSPLSLPPSHADPHPCEQVSNQIYAALLPQIGKLNVLLDSNESLAAIYQLLTAMDPGTISVQVKHCSITFSLVYMLMYVAILLQEAHNFSAGSMFAGIVHLSAEEALPDVTFPPVSVAKSGVHSAGAHGHHLP